MSNRPVGYTSEEAWQQRLKMVERRRVLQQRTAQLFEYGIEVDDTVLPAFERELDAKEKQ